MTMTSLTKEKPDLLFNNPLKQKVYLFLKGNPGKDFEMFQVLVGDAGVSRQHFLEVEQAIRSREEREKAKAAASQGATIGKEANAFFLDGIVAEKSRGPGRPPHEKKDKKEPNLMKTEKKQQNSRAKEYIQSNPDCTYEELVHALGFKELSKAHFFSMKTQLRKKGLIPDQSRTRRSRKGEAKAPTASRQASTNRPALATKTIEIVASVDATGFSDELKEHYKSHFLPLLQKLWPGQDLHIVFLSDPPTIEIRRAPR